MYIYIVYMWVGELTPSLFLGCSVPALPPELVFAPFLINCGRGESLGTTTCLRTVFGLSKGMLPVR